MKNLFVLLCLVVSSTAFAADQEAQQKDINTLKCTAGVQKSMITSAVPLQTNDKYPNLVVVDWDYQQFIVQATEDGRLGITVRDGIASFKPVRKFTTSFTTEWPTEDKPFSYEYKHPAVDSQTYSLVCVVKK